MIPATSTPQQRANFMDTVSASSWSRCTARKKQPFSNVIFDVCFSFFVGVIYFASCCYTGALISFVESNKSAVTIVAEITYGFLRDTVYSS